MTTLYRTAVDASRGLELPAALVVLDAAARAACAAMVGRPRRSDYAVPRLQAAAREGLAEAARRRRGLAAVRTALPLVDPKRETPIESLTAGHLHQVGLPMPEFQAPVHTPAGVLYPDCLWRDQRLIGEADGAVKYTSAEVMLREKEREQVFRDLGFTVVRWLGKEIVGRPRVVMDRIARALGC